MTRLATWLGTRPFDSRWLHVAAMVGLLFASASALEGQTLPAPWAAQDIGTPALAGHATFASNTFSVSGGGVDIWNASDQFQFMYQPMNGDGSIVALVSSLQNTDPWAKAGVMIRQDLTGGAANAMSAVTVSNGMTFQERLTPGGASGFVNGFIGAAPYWVRLVRSGNTFTGYYSATGSAWILMGSTTISMPTNVYVGLAVTSHNPSVLGSDTFSNVTVSSAATPPPTLTTLNPTSGAVGAAITMAGTNFGASQGSSTVTFNGTTATPTNWSSTSLMVPVPGGATTGSVVVTVGGQASNAVPFTVSSPPPIPTLTSLNPTSGLVGAGVAITGTNFGTTQGTSTVRFNGTATTPTGWSGTSISAPVPAGATTGTVVVTVGGQASNGITFTVTTPPTLTTVNPSSGLVVSGVAITGTGFGTTQGTSTVRFNGTAATPSGWSATSISAPVPAGATTGAVVVTVGGQASNGITFTVTAPAPPSLTSVNPTSGVVGAAATMAGTNFGATQGASSISFNGAAATPTSWSATSIGAPVPAGATTGNVVVTVGGQASNGMSFTVTTSGLPAPWTSQDVGGPTLAGHATYASGAFSVTGSGVDIYNSSDQFQFVYQPLNGDGSIVALVSSLQNTDAWTKAGVMIRQDLTGGAANAMSAVTVSNGMTFQERLTAGGASGFINGFPGAAPYWVRLVRSVNTFTGYYSATGTSWILMGSATIPMATNVYAGLAVTSHNPSMLATGAFSNVTVSSGATPPPSLTSLSPTSGAVGVAVAMAGSNFGTSQGASTITFNGTAATPTSWSSTSLVAPVPGGATTGPVVVTVGGQASNAVAFTVSSAPPPTPTLTSLSPTSGTAGTAVTMAGTNFGTTQGTSTVRFNGTVATPTSWSATSISAPAPTGVTTGLVVVTVGGQVSNGINFTVSAPPPPSLTSLSPTSGMAGTAVTMTGANFGASQGSSTVAFNGTVATPTSWSATSISAPVPSGAVTGNVVVTVGGQSSNAVSFTILQTTAVTATWSANSESDIAGYVLSYGTQTGVYTSSTDVGNVTTWQGQITSGVGYYFAVKAYNTGLLFSPYSAEVFFTAAGGSQIAQIGAPANQAVGTSGRGAPSVRTGGQDNRIQMATATMMDPTIAAFWPLNDGVGSKAFDASGRRMIGTLVNGPAWTAGRLGGALSFDGVNAHVTTNFVENLAAWTVALWVQSPAAPSSGPGSGPVQREKNFQINWNDPEPQFRGAVALSVGGSWYAASFGPLTANTWYHLVGTYDGITLRAYTNGVLVTANSAAFGVPDVESLPLEVGARAGATSFFAGVVSGVRVYRRAISGPEVGELARPDATPPTRVTLSASSIGGAVSLSWTAAADLASGVSLYRIYRGTESGGAKVLLAEDAAIVVRYQDRATTSFSTYYYAVAAVNGSGVEGLPSNEVVVVAP